MDDQTLSQSYEKPRVVDYGDLQQLTADCGKAAGGDAAFPSGSENGISFGVSNPAAGCKSNP
jgi:hypothetical protein